jgi:hypothetical protein
MNSEHRLRGHGVVDASSLTGGAHEDSAIQVPARIKATAPCSGYWASRCCLVTSLEWHVVRIASTDVVCEFLVLSAAS